MSALQPLRPCHVETPRRHEHMFPGVRETTVSTPDRCRATRRAAAIVLAALAWTIAARPRPLRRKASSNCCSAGSAGASRIRRPAPMPTRAVLPATLAPPIPPADYSGGPTSGGGHGAAYCVRTCDGRYFPLQRNAGASPAELCKSFCPAAKTMVFSGSKIDHAVGPDGTRYADLDNAFAYRDKVVDNCTCNGKDASRARARRRRPRIRPCGRATSSPPTTA